MAHVHYNYPAEYQVAKAIASTLPFNGTHLATFRKALNSIVAGNNNVDHRRVAEGIILDRPLPDETFEALMNVMMAASPIEDSQLRTLCLEVLTMNNFAEFMKSHGVWLIGSANTCKIKAVDCLIETLNNSGTWRDQARKEGVYYELMKRTKATYHFSEFFKLAGRCGSEVATQIIPHLSRGTPSSAIRQIVACLRGSEWHVENPEHIAHMAALMVTLNKNELSKVVDAIEISLDKLIQMPRNIARNFFHAFSWENTQPGNKQKQAAEKVKAALSSYCYQHYGLISGNNRKDIFDRLIKDLTRTCRKWEPALDLMIPDSFWEAPMEVLMDLNNAMMDYITEMGLEAEGYRMFPGFL
ncbi:hypothetical protein PG995_014934 [Apiospora arundinis]